MTALTTARADNTGFGRTAGWLGLALTAAATVFAVAGCSMSTNSLNSNQTPTSGFPTDVTKNRTRTQATTASTQIALLLPLSATGQTAEIAKGLRQAAELALFDRNLPGVKLVVKDTAGTPEGARKAAEAAVASGAEIILGPLFAKSVTAIRPVTQAANIPVIAFSNDRSVAGNGVYLLSFQAHQDVTRVVSYAASQNKLRFAALIPDDTRGKRLLELFRASVAQTNGTIIALETYPPGANGMLEKAQKLFETVAEAETMGAPIDAVFVPGGPETLPTLGPIIKYTKVDVTRVKLIGTGSWDFSSLSRQKTFLGGWYPAPDPRGWASFSAKYAKTYSAAAPRIASFAYDAVSIAISLATSAQQGQRFTAARLTQASGFSGVDGLVRLRSDGLCDRGLAILQVDNNASMMIDPAPRVFGAPQG